MAALAGYGTLPHSADQMYPLFRPAALRPNNTLPSSETNDVYNTGFDGTSEPYSSSNTFNSYDSDHAERPRDKEPHLRSAIPPNVLTTNLTCTSANFDTDAEHDRRKRRKITPSGKDKEEDEDRSQQRGGDVDLSQLQNSNNAAAAQTVDIASNPVQSAVRDANAENEATTTSPTRRKSPRTTRIKDDSVQDSASPRKSQSMLSRSENTRSESKRGTPKKKMLQLTADGRLANSPKWKVKQADGKSLLATSAPGQLGIKNGQIVSSRKVCLLYGREVANRQAIGVQIDNILTNQARVTLPGQSKPESKPRSLPISSKPAHPFFGVRKGTKSGCTSTVNTPRATSTAPTSDSESVKIVKQPKPWSEIVFGGSKTGLARDIITIEPPWPPQELQHLRPISDGLGRNCMSRPMSVPSKLKGGASVVPATEDIMNRFGIALRETERPSSIIQFPQRCLLTNSELCAIVDDGDQPVIPSIQCIRQRALTTKSAFDRGVAAGPQLWANDYAPRASIEVLQPHANVLFEWLAKLQVHNVRSASANPVTRGRPKLTTKKRRAPKRADDLDDFIAPDEEEAVGGTTLLKNAILIAGPSGCGKTASVYAVAQQLGFEVFEIHSGMRRSSKDIFDKVGDMAQNHLVQHSNILSRNPSTLTEDDEIVNVQLDGATSKQQTMGVFMAGSKAAKKSTEPKADLAAEPLKQLQKQSVILFEEVDILFEEDKAFWSGVQTLIQQSKRPVILTCNSPASIPIEDLELHTIITYERQPVQIAEQYLAYLAAAEGHLLPRKSLQSLYLSKGCDLRGAINELNLWCQMGVGSVLGGLDWMPQHGREANTDAQGSLRRTISRNTFTEGLNLLPDESLDPEALLQYAEDNLSLSTLDLEDALTQSSPSSAEAASLSTLDDMLAWADARSCMDMVDKSVIPLLSTAVSCVLPERAKPMNRRTITQMCLTQSDSKTHSRSDLAGVFETLMDDNRTFPPSTGRSPSIDTAGEFLATEVAPYVRSIAFFDLRLEKYRQELAGASPSKPGRTTRAARAAQEGGDKASTRRERWFPRGLDLTAVLSTGNGWPQHAIDPEPCQGTQTPMSTQSAAVEDGG